MSHRVNIWRAHLTIRTAEVVVAGVTRTHHVPLDEVGRFEARVQSGAGNGTPLIALIRRRAAPIGIYALSRQLAFIWSFKRSCAKLVPQADELDRLVAEARSARR